MVPKSLLMSTLYAMKREQKSLLGKAGIAVVKKKIRPVTPCRLATRPCHHRRDGRVGASADRCQRCRAAVGTKRVRKLSKINEADRYSAAHNGLVEGSSAVRTNNEINSYSEPCSRPRWTLAPSIGEVPSSSERAACIAPNAEKFDNQKPRAASFLFVRRGTQSYDEFIAAVPLLASPEHDARDDQHVRYFLDWRKRKCDHVRDKTNALQ